MARPSGRPAPQGISRLLVWQSVYGGRALAQPRLYSDSDTVGIVPAEAGGPRTAWVRLYWLLRLKWLRRVALYPLAACVLTSPLLLHFNTHIPLGTEAAASVPLLNVWTLLWNSDRLAYGYTSSWNAPIFYPTLGAFALSELQPLTGLAFATVHFVTRYPALVYARLRPLPGFSPLVPHPVRP